jgi:multiple sugar transport system ATP-binding protein
MNLIDADVVQNGAQVSLKLDDEVVIHLPADKAKKLVDGGYVGKTVIVGIRPEDIKDDPEFIEKHQEAAFTTKIRVYELLGAEANLHFDIRNTTCAAKVDSRTKARPGDTVTFATDFSRMHIFDKETELVITH